MVKKLMWTAIGTVWNAIDYVAFAVALWLLYEIGLWALEVVSL